MKIHLYVFILAILLGCRGESEDVSKTDATSSSVTANSSATFELVPPDSDFAGVIKKQFYAKKGNKLESYLYNIHYSPYSNFTLLKSDIGLFSLRKNSPFFTFNSDNEGVFDVYLSAEKEGEKYKFDIRFIVNEQPIIDGYPSITDNDVLHTGLTVTPGQTVNFHLNAKTVPSDTKLYITNVGNEIIDSVDVNYSHQEPKHSEPWKNGFG